jgi:bifunctional non-homologous end joining protein LigD
VAGGRIRATGRNRHDLTPSFPELLGLPSQLPSSSTILDGEIVVLDADGLPKFALLQQRLNLGSATTVVRRAKEFPATYLVFDVLSLDGRSMLTSPYDERRATLESLGLNQPGLVTSQAYSDRPGAEVFTAAIRQGIEGVVAKRRGSLYLPGERSPDWIKVKAIRTQEVVIVGWVTGQGRLGDTFGSLMMGIPSADGIEYVGRVGAGFDAVTRAELMDLMAPLATETPAFREELDPRDEIGAHFIAAELVGEVRFSAWTRDSRMRHPSWRGLRHDKTVADVRREE